MILWFFFLSFGLSAQNLTEDFGLLSKGLKFIESPQLDSECIKEKEAYAQAVCTFPEGNENDSKGKESALLYKVTADDQLHPQLKKQLKINEKIDKSSPLFIKIGLVNDNFVSLQKANDLNYTHGVLLEAWKTTASGKTFGANFNSDLYTKRILLAKTADGRIVSKPFTNWSEAKSKLEKGESYIKRPEKTEDIEFVEDSWLSLFMNNKAKGEWLTWQAGIGFEKIEQQELKKIGAANFQNLLHQNANIVKYVYHPSEQDTQYNLFLTGEIGARKDIFKGHFCDVTLHGEIYGGMDLEKVRRYIGARLKTEIRLISLRGTEEKLVRLNFAPTLWKQDERNKSTLTAGAGLNLKGWQIGYQYIIPLQGTPFSNFLSSSAAPMDTESMGQITITAPINWKKKKQK